MSKKYVMRYKYSLILKWPFFSLCNSYASTREYLVKLDCLIIPSIKYIIYIHGDQKQTITIRRDIVSWRRDPITVKSGSAASVWTLSTL